MLPILPTKMLVIALKGFKPIRNKEVYLSPKSIYLLYKQSYFKYSDSKHEQTIGFESIACINRYIPLKIPDIQYLDQFETRYSEHLVILKLHNYM